MYESASTSRMLPTKTGLGQFGTTLGKTASTYLTCACLVGTGGYATADYLAKRNDRGYKLIQFNLTKQTSDVVLSTQVTQNSVRNLARIREILKPTITELANLFGVSRQAVYDWQAGKPVAPENALRLEEFAKAAELLSAQQIQISSQVLRRKVLDGKSLLDALRSGGPVYDIAAALAQILDREGVQREKLAARLIGRQRPVVSVDDVGIPLLNERV